MSVCIGVSECTGGPGLFSLGAGTPQTLLTLQLPHMGGLVTTDGTPTLWSTRCQLPHHSQDRTCGCRRGEPREPCPPAPSSCTFQATWCTGSHRYTRVCTHTDVHTQNLLPSGRAAHAHILSSGCTVCDNDRVCGATAHVWACAGDVTTRPGRSQPQGRWKPQSLRFLEPNGAVSVGKSSFLRPVLPSPLQPWALRHTDQSQLREKVGVGTEQRLGSVPSTVLLGRSQPSSASGAGQGRAAIRMSFPFDGPSSGEGRWMSVPEAGTFPGEAKVEHDQACYNPPSPPRVSPWTPKSPPPARRGTEAR